MGESKLLRQRIECSTREFRVQPHVAVKQPPRRQASQQQVGVCHRGAPPSASITRRPRIGSRADRPHLHQAIPVKPSDGTASGPNRLDIHTGQSNGKPGHITVEGNVHLVVPDQRDIGACASHVQRDHIATIGLAGNMRRPNRSCGWPGKRGAHREFTRTSRRHQTSTGLVDSKGGLGRSLGNSLLKGFHVSSHHGLQVGVQHGRGKPLVLTKFRLNF